MKRGQFSQEQIVAILHEAERGEQTLGALCRDKGITVSEASRLKELEKENTRLKRLLAERDMEVDILKEFLQKK